MFAGNKILVCGTISADLEGEKRSVVVKQRSVCRQNVCL